MTTLVWLVIALPVAGAAILLLSGRRSDGWGHLLGCLAALASFGVGGGPGSSTGSTESRTFGFGSAAAHFTVSK